VPLLAVLPGHRGTDAGRRQAQGAPRSRRFFCTIEEGIKGKRAVAWRLVDEIVPNSKLEAKVTERVKQFAAASRRNGTGKAFRWSPWRARSTTAAFVTGLVSVDIDRSQRIATISIEAAGRRPARRYRGHDRTRGLVLAAAGRARA